MKITESKKSECYGLNKNEFSKLDPKLQKKILILLARVSEKSYRRGVQQGIVLKIKKAIAHNIEKYRFYYSLNKSYFLDEKRAISSMERLLTRYPNIIKAFSLKEKDLLK